MSKQNEDAIKQLAGVVAQLANIIISHYPTEVVGTAKQGIPAFDPNLKGSELVREHFRRGGGELRCLIDDRSDSKAIEDGVTRLVRGYDVVSGRFLSANTWTHAVACDNSRRVLTASELLG